MDLLFKGYIEFQFGEMKKFWKLIEVVLHNIVRVTNITQLHVEK